MGQENINVDVICQRIIDLTREVREGFVGVHARQDKTNNKIEDHTIKIISLEKKDIEICSKVKNTKLTWAIMGFMAGIIMFLLEKMFR